MAQASRVGMKKENAFYGFFLREAGRATEDDAFDWSADSGVAEELWAELKLANQNSNNNNNKRPVPITAMEFASAVYAFAALGQWKQCVEALKESFTHADTKGLMVRNSQWYRSLPVAVFLSSIVEHPQLGARANELLMDVAPGVDLQDDDALFERIPVSAELTQAQVDALLPLLADTEAVLL
eukprot:TRINITY_DN66418_c9_g1_i4.p4 TRINITY_DN66418_c9_g1~~TRINITY_DN66418_c9_g1_i4.p4  ORF type:complete len:183 (+),score=101.89 TRINITY_DN66418_c9_g1_i4:287-835(+)